MRWTLCLLAFCVCACGPSAPTPEAAPDVPSANREGTTASQHHAYPDDFKIAGRIELPRLEPFWQGAVLPATLFAEPALAVCVDKQGEYSTRAKGEAWKPRTEPDLLHTLRLFAEESVDGDTLRSNCQVVLGADRNAPMHVVLGVLEMLAQARISRLFMLTQERKSVTLLLDLGLPAEGNAPQSQLILSRSGENSIARLDQERTTQANWSDQLSEIVARVKTSPAELAISASTVSMLEVEAALNACAKLGMTTVRFVI